MTADAIPRPGPDVVFTRFDATSAALLHLKTKRYYTLNETGARIWELLVSGKAPREIATSLNEEYDIGLDEAETCVIELLNDLRAEGLVTA
jgi:hypothetical protein